MYRFSLSDDRILFATNEDTNEQQIISEKICWFHEYDNYIFALGIDEMFSTIYQVVTSTLLVETVVKIPRNINHYNEGHFPMLTYDKVITIEFYEPYVVYIVRENCKSLGYNKNQVDCLMVTNIRTKETKQLYEWKPKGEAGFLGIGIPDCYEEPEVTLNDEWINIKTTFKEPSRDYWFTNGVMEAQNFRIRYDGTEMQNLN